MMDPYTYPLKEKAIKHLSYVKYIIGIQSEVVCSLDHEVVVPFSPPNIDIGPRTYADLPKW